MEEGRRGPEGAKELQVPEFEGEGVTRKVRAAPDVGRGAS